MKNLITLIILSIALLSQVQAQNLSVNNSNSIERYQLTKGQTELGLSTGEFGGIYISHRYSLSDRFVFRSKLRIPEFKFNNTEERGNVNETTFGAGIGIEYHIPIKKRWAVYIGAEGNIEWHKRNSDIPLDDLKHQRYRFNGFTGVKFYANERLSFYTELKYGYNIERFNSERSAPATHPAMLEAGAEFGVQIKLGKK